MLWPSQKLAREQPRAKDRGKRLCDLLSLTHRDEVMRNANHLRDSLEHVDERLDAWVAQSRYSNLYLHAIIGSHQEPKGMSQRDKFTRYNTDTHSFSMQGHSVDLSALEERITEIYEKATTAYHVVEVLIARLQSPGGHVENS